MAMQTHEFKAKSVDEAIEEGLTTLSVTRDAVDIEIVNKGSRGIFGIGSEPAVVRLVVRSTPPIPEESLPPTSSSAPDSQNAPSTQPKVTAIEPQTASLSTANGPLAEETPDIQDEMLEEEEDLVASFNDDEDEDDEYEEDADTEPNQQKLAPVTTASEDELATMAADMLGEIIYLMGFKADITASWQDDEDEDEDEGEGSTGDDQENSEVGEEVRKRYLHLDIEGTDLGPLIGRRGETLDNLQYLLRLMINQKIHKWKNIIIDVEHYKERRLNQLRQLADRMADQVARTGRAISLEPMPANERRIVHMVLRDHPNVYTESYGEGPRRKVHIFARD